MKKVFHVVLATAFYAVPAAALAQREVNYGFTNFTRATNLGTNAPVVATVASIINILLGFLGVFAIVAIVIGGFRVMTSGGNEEQTSGGRKVMTAGVIGLIIIFVAYALAYFIVNQLATSTGATA